MSGRQICHPTIGAVARVTALGCRRDGRLRLLMRWGQVELRRQWLGARNDPRDVWVFAGPRGCIRPSFLGFEPTGILFLPPVLSGLFLCSLLKARSRVLAHYS